VVRKLGQGGMGEVYLGEHTLIGRRAAIKILHAERSAQRENVERFFNEARATSAVADPGIVAIFDFGVTPTGTAYIVMEYLDGEPLSMRLRRRGRLTATDAVRITRQLAGSLAAAHAVGIVHRDLKPENLFMIRDPEAPGGERPKILDFGIAKLDDDNQDRFRTRTGVVMGTPAYMSPEQCSGTGKIDTRSDIYSLGCVLFHLLTGRIPFDLEGVGAIISAHLREEAAAPSMTMPGVPPIVDPLVARCMAKRPDARFATMTEVQQACDALLAQLPATMTAPEAPWLQPTIQGERVTTLGTSAGQASGQMHPARRGLWLAAGAAAIVGGVAMAVMTYHHGASESDPAASIAPAVQPRPAVTADAAVMPTPPPPPAVAPGPAPAPAPVPAPAPTHEATPPVKHPAAPPPPKTVPKKHKQPGDMYEDRT
jgi:serine/threonine-protein kinase